MDDSLPRFQSDNYLEGQQSENRINPDAIIAKNWIDLGHNYLKERYYLKALLCFETALSVDQQSVDKSHRQINNLIWAGLIQEAHDAALTMVYPVRWSVDEPWAIT